MINSLGIARSRSSIVPHSLPWRVIERAGQPRPPIETKKQHRIPRKQAVLHARRVPEPPTVKALRPSTAHPPWGAGGAVDPKRKKTRDAPTRTVAPHPSRADAREG